MKRFILIAAALVLSFSAMTAQDRPEGPGGERTKQTTAKERAKMQAERLKDELQLSDNQYKKVYKAILSRENEVASLMPQRRPGGMGSGGGGMRPGGMGPGSGGMRPGGMGPGSGGVRPPVTGMNNPQEQVKAARDKCDKKIKKVLSEEQYARYEELEAQRMKEMQDRMKNMRNGGQRPPQPGN